MALNGPLFWQGSERREMVEVRRGGLGRRKVDRCQRLFVSKPLFASGT